MTMSHLALSPGAGRAAHSPGSPLCTCTPDDDGDHATDHSPVQPRVPRGQATDDQAIVASDPESGVWPDQQVTHTEHPALVMPGGHTGAQPRHEAG